MCSSPPTQVGASRPPASSTCQLWSAIGVPYGTEVQAGSTRSTGYAIDQIDASVAPPRLTTRAFGATRRIRSGSATGTQSPLSSTSRSAGSRTPAVSASSTSSCMSAGTEFQTVTDSRVASSSQLAGSRSSSVGMTSVAPAAGAPNTSYTDRSKHSEEMPKTRSAGPTPNRRLTSWIVFSGPRWSSIAPLGRPVEPEV
jgi:hypothetical protein